MDKINVSLCMPVRQRWVEVQFLPFLSLAVPEGKWSIYCHGCFTPHWKPPWYPMHRRQHGLHSWSGNSLAPARKQTMIPQSFSPQLSPVLLNPWHAAFTAIPIIPYCFILWTICVRIQMSDCGDWANTWYWAKHFRILSNKKQQQPHLLPNVLPYHNPRVGLHKNYSITIILWIHYTMIITMCVNNNAVINNNNNNGQLKDLILLLRMSSKSLSALA